MSAPAPRSPWSQACLAARLFAVDPLTGGVALRCGAGPTRDAWLKVLRACLDPAAPLRRVPAGIADDRLLGGVDLGASLRAGKPVAEAGALALADGGVIVLAMAERLSAGTAARIALALDRGEVTLARDGVATRWPARFGVVALDEGQGEDERPPEALLDRLAFPIDLSDIGHRACLAEDADRAELRAAASRLGAVRHDDDAMAALVGAAMELGIVSLRAPLLALRVARAAAALRCAHKVDAEDVALAARLVLGPRATRLPSAQEPQDAQDAQNSEPEEPPPPQEDGKSEEPTPEQAAAALDELVLAAARAAIPPGLLALIGAGLKPRGRAAQGGKAGAEAASAKRGRPLAARRGELRQGKLSLIDTLRAAAPWQVLRARQGGGSQGSRLIVKPDDFRVIRFKERRRTTAIFVVDASGSSAIQRLGEVKGAIELLLADCYVRRDSVAMVAFRGQGAEVVLPPTRSLALAKRRLAGLPGGGGTPIAAGLEAALALADAVRRKGQTPLVVLMTDGRANVARDRQPGRAHALADAIEAAKGLAAAGVASLAIDTSGPGPAGGEPPTRALGRAMAARYLALPSAGAATVSAAVRAAS